MVRYVGFRLAGRSSPLGSKPAPHSVRRRPTLRRTGQIEDLLARRVVSLLVERRKSEIFVLAEA